LMIPDLPSAAARDALAAEDMLIKYARNESASAANWNPALHPRRRCNKDVVRMVAEPTLQRSARGRS
jgi:hypothetical protein